MDKMRMESPDLTAGNVEKIGAMFPNCVTETVDEHGKPKKAVNFKILKQMLSDEVVDGDEAYEFTWAGKKAAILEANRPIRKTLRPCPAESKNWDATENLYIEGDNLEVLKLLQESYLGKVKMIYIDPPYNTGNDFVYADDFVRSQDEENRQMGVFDEEDNRLFKNTDTNGRFHSDWCSMIYPRLKLAASLLRDDGVIFISIDDHEVANMRKICEEIFGAQNFICAFIWKSKLGKVGTASIISSTHEYILCFAKNASEAKFKMVETENDGRKENLRQWGQADRKEDRPSMYYPININGITVFPIKEDGTEGRWRVGEDKAIELLKSGQLQLVNKNGKNTIYRKFPSGTSVTTYETLLSNEVGTTAQGAESLRQLNMARYFDYSKSPQLIKKFLTISNLNSSDLVLDFFSGSATTAHAVMQLNAEDGGHRKFIMVQLPEACDEKSEAFKAGYRNICEIGKERIRRAGEKIRNEKAKAEAGNSSFPTHHSSLDVGFRVFKLDDSNMKDVYYAVDEIDQRRLEDMISNIKDGRGDLDLLFGCLLDWGLPLSMPYRSEQIGGCTVHTVGDGDLIACFADRAPEAVVKEIARRKPLRAVFRDSCFADSPAKINAFEIFKSYMPEDAGDISKRVRVL